LLDADVDYSVAVVAQDDVDQVLADVVDVPVRPVASRIDPFSDPSTFSILGSRCRTAAFITSALWRERQLHLARSEKLADGSSCRSEGRRWMIARGS